ncbi:MAG: hypothetical protein U0325_11305 [Polyangiales bacterium]
MGGGPEDGSTADISATADAAADVACGEGLRTCGGRCVSVATSAEHCGACDRRCGAGELCQNWPPACPPAVPRRPSAAAPTRASPARTS